MSDRTDTSGEVSRLRFPCMLFLLAIDEAHDCSGNASMSVVEQVELRDFAIFNKSISDLRSLASREQEDDVEAGSTVEAG